jgi:hypothetical protein
MRGRKQAVDVSESGLVRIDYTVLVLVLVLVLVASYVGYGTCGHYSDFLIQVLCTAQ